MVSLELRLHSLENCASMDCCPSGICRGLLLEHKTNFLKILRKSLYSGIKMQTKVGREGQNPRKSRKRRKYLNILQWPEQRHYRVISVCTSGAQSTA